MSQANAVIVNTSELIHTDLCIPSLASFLGVPSLSIIRAPDFTSLFIVCMMVTSGSMHN